MRDILYAVTREMNPARISHSLLNAIYSCHVLIQSQNGKLSVSKALYASDFFFGAWNVSLSKCRWLSNGKQLRLLRLGRSAKAFDKRG
jgi:hypothetical protein